MQRQWPHQTTNQSIQRSHAHARKSASKSGSYSSRMRLTLHATRPTPHVALRLVQAMSAWLVTTRLAPSRLCRDAKVYGHTTTAMHGISTPPASFHLRRRRCFFIATLMHACARRGVRLVANFSMRSYAADSCPIFLFH